MSTKTIVTLGAFLLICCAGIALLTNPTGPSTENKLSDIAKSQEITGPVDNNQAFQKANKTAKTNRPAKPKRGVLGEQAPNLGVETWFNLPKGRNGVDIGDYKGKVIYLYGFQSWCPGCHRSGFPTLTKLINHYKNNKDVAFIAVQTTFEGFGTNTPQSAEKTAQRYGLTIPIGHDGSESKRSTIMQRYRTGGTPWTIIIDRGGKVRFNDFHIKPDAGIKLIDRLLKNGIPSQF